MDDIEGDIFGLKLLIDSILYIYLPTLAPYESQCFAFLGFGIAALLQCFLVGYDSLGKRFVKLLRVGNLSRLAQDSQYDRGLVRLLPKFSHLP